MKRLMAIILFVLPLCAKAQWDNLLGDVPYASVNWSNNLVGYIDEGWHDGGLFQCWPSSNYASFAGNLLYEMTNAFILTTNVVFNTDSGIVTQSYDVMLSTPADFNWGTWAIYSNVFAGYTFLYWDGSKVYTNTFEYGYQTNFVQTNAYVNARQLRMLDCFNAMYERKVADGASRNMSYDVNIPYMSLYTKQIQSVQSIMASFLRASTNGTITNTFNAVEADWGYVDKYYVDNGIVDYISTAFPDYEYSVLEGSPSRNEFGTMFKAGSSSFTNENINMAIPIFSRYGVPTNYSYWIPANLSWIENNKHERVEDNKFLTASNTIVTITVTNSNGDWVNLGLDGIAEGYNSLDYSLDQIKNNASNIVYTYGAVQFNPAVIKSGFASHTNFYSAVTSAFGTATITTNDSNYTGWYWQSSAFNNFPGTLYFVGFETRVGQTLWSNMADKFLKSGIAYGWDLDMTVGGDWIGTVTELDSFTDTMDGPYHSGATFGEDLTEDDIVEPTIGNPLGAGKRYDLIGTIYDYSNGFNYK